VRCVASRTHRGPGVGQYTALDCDVWHTHSSCRIAHADSVGDVNGDGVVDVNDRPLTARNRATKYCVISFIDLDGDSSVRKLDYNIPRAHNGRKLP